ncbi:hypothetical protein FSP39_002629 [Pinctada imbricata]|uniref:Tyr recombinase domain-containing protein n=1 Tax=Pinctada imbricata TaxID=66713 RepID=A0AA88Y337_PINIB|nr:hypothetical protein FSP39_002629 [Pinctada imbricata]
MAELKRMGKGDVTHFPIISDSDLQKLYFSIHMSTLTPQGLFNKVHFDARLYFCRRRNKNMYSMTQDTFYIVNDENTGRKYVEKVVDEMTKNRRFGKEASSGLMPETPDSPFCHVASFESYISKLHPGNARIWQRPKDTFNAEDQIWYCNVPVGEKKLSSFMSGLSKSVGLSKSYTNHSIRATGATILSKGMYGLAHVMAVTGHKSVQSLSVYQRVSSDEKIQMADMLFKNIVPVPKNVLPALPSTEQLGSSMPPAGSENVMAPALPSTERPTIMRPIPF